MQTIIKNIVGEYMKMINNKYIKKYKEYFLNIIRIIRRNEMRILPGNIAFFLILSIVPLITLVGILGSNFTDAFDKIIEFINMALPKEVVNLLLPFFRNASSSDSNIVIFLILGFITASNGAQSIIIASNTLYNVENKNVVFRRIKAFLLTIILILLFLFIVIGLTFSNVIYNFFVDIDIITFDRSLVFIFNLLKWPIAVFIIFFTIRLLYTLSVDKKINSHYITNGAMFTTLGWIILTLVYSIYADNYAHYDIFYGSLSNLIILMIWIYFLSYILVIGIAINSDIYSKLVINGKIKE